MKKVNVKTIWYWEDGSMTTIDISRDKYGVWAVIDLETGEDLQADWEPRDFKEFSQLFEGFEV